MIRYILVEKKKKTLDRVKAKIDSIAKDFELEHISSYSSSKEAAETVNPDTYDLLVVDFEMPVFNGVELAERIATGKKVIFLTSTENNEKLVINAIDIAGYLTKPFEIIEFQNILKKKFIGAASFSQASNYTFLNFGVNTHINIASDKVYYITKLKSIDGKRAKRNCVNIYGKNDKLLFENIGPTTIEQLSQDLKDQNFSKINQSVLVNTRFIKERDHLNLSLYDCKEAFSVSNTNKNTLIASFKRFINKF